MSAMVAIKRLHTNQSFTFLYDRFGRIHDYLRVSLTERCNLRCKYCMPAEGLTLTNKQNLLELDELTRLSTIFVRLCGIRKIRLTGGEPTVDKKLEPLIEHLNKLRNDGLQTVAMTTNGLNLKRNASRYKQLGLDAINVSLDTLQEKRFESMSRRKGWHLVMDGIKEALKVRFDCVKLNCVVIKDFNDDEIFDFCNLAFQYPIDIRFIEFMPFWGNKWKFDSVVPFNSMVTTVKSRYPALRRLSSMEHPNETSKIFKDPDMLGSIGFITSITDHFCAGCNRLRLTADGHLKVCLFDQRETSLRDLIRHGANDDELRSAIEIALLSKRKQHGGISLMNGESKRPMIKIVQARSMHSDNKSHLEKFSHLDKKGAARMVDIGGKVDMHRIAIARGEIIVGQTVLTMIREQNLKKGDIITVSKIAGILGAKQTSSLIPMCHQVNLDYVLINIIECEQNESLIVDAQVETSYKTGVEMECLMAVSMTLLTIYDMCKSVNRSMSISNIRLISKTKV